MQVNVRTSGAQANSAIVMDPRGGAVVVWSSYYSGRRSNDIVARRLDRNRRSRPREEFLVNAVNVGNQTEPAAAIDSQGNLAVVWQGAGPDEDIILRLYDPYRIPLTSDLLVNLRRRRPAAVSVRRKRPYGTFLVAWESRETTVYGDQAFLYAQLFDPNGAGLGDEILVDPNLYDCRYPDVAMDAEGNFVVAWMRDRSNHPILARLFDPNGVPRTDPFAVNTTERHLGDASVHRDELARPLHDRLGRRPQPGSRRRRLRKALRTERRPTGEPFIVNAIRDGAQQWPQAAINDANEFVVVWEYDSGDPNAATDIYARRFDANGRPVDEEFRLNTYTDDRQRYADVAMTADGSFFAVWESNGQDGAGYGIFAHTEPRPDPNEPPGREEYTTRPWQSRSRNVRRHAASAA